jgi:hypothetical protein
MALVVVAFVGCDTEPKPRIDAALPQGNSPEAKLERVIERLKFALKSAQGAADYGVVSTRDLRHRLIPPTEKESRPTAEVTILTTITLSNGAETAAAGADGEAEENPPPEPTTEKEVFLLVYENGKWDLPNKPKSETLQLCFESALREE